MSFMWVGVEEKNICKLVIGAYIKAQIFPMSQKYMMSMDEDEYNKTFGEKKGFVVSSDHNSDTDIIIFDTTLNENIQLIPATCKMCYTVHELKKN